VETRTCTHDATHKEPRSVAALGHDYQNWTVTTAPTYFEEGEETGTCSHDGSHTTTRTVAKNQYITDIAEIAYLNDRPANTVDTPVLLPMQIALANLTMGSGSKWQQLLEALETAGKFVDLDLSACTMTVTEFNPVRTVATGKDKIVSIALPDTATSIATGSFSAGGGTFFHFTVLKSFSGAGITSISNAAFYGCTGLSLTSLQEGITAIGERAFYGCTGLSLTSLPAGLTTIDNSAFRDCTNLAMTSLPAGITSIGNYAFMNCTKLALTSLPEGITAIGEMTFYNCAKLALTSLPAGVTTIGDAAFTDCKSLTRMTLPAGLTTIGTNFFRLCDNLTLVTCLAETPPTVGGNLFLNTHASLSIKVPAASVDAYKAATNWSTFAGRISAITE
jgi:hypothetical protein